MQNPIKIEGDRESPAATLALIERARGGFRPVTALDARDYSTSENRLDPSAVLRDVAHAASQIAADLESRFGVTTTIEAHYPKWIILAKGERIAEAAEHAQIFRDA
jgi:hypothetical protein